MPGVMNGYPQNDYHGGPRPHPQQMPDPYGYGGYTDDPRRGRPREEDPYARRGGYGQRGIPEDPYSRGPDPTYSTRPDAPSGIHPARGGPPRGYDTRDRQHPQNRNGFGSPDVPTYELDHLATFTVGKRQGFVTPDEGIERLRHMEMTTGIWTMRCNLVVEDKDVTIIDKQTEEEMEKFPLELIEEPSARMNQDRRDVYNNIVLFTVAADNQRNTDSEMHIFQCINKPAQDVVEDIQAAKSGRHSRGRGASLPPPPPPINEPPRKPDPRRDMPDPRYNHRDEERERAAYRSARAAENYKPGPKPSEAFHQSMYRDDTESVLSDKTDRHVQLLNHCFDDIERFVGRLQQAAEAFRQLEKRRHGREKKNKKGMGDGMLSVRARPPPAKEFIDIFQKFKLAFNLLAKLKSHIHDPNAPELVHFLFTPLSLVVEASKDPANGAPDLAAKVVSPLLSNDSKELLLNCLTSKETDLWRSLGDAWTVSRDEWVGYVPPYFPRFSDGWQPSPSVIEELTGPVGENMRPASPHGGRISGDRPASPYVGGRGERPASPHGTGRADRMEPMRHKAEDPYRRDRDYDRTDPYSGDYNPRHDNYRGPRDDNSRQDNYREPREENPRQDNYRGPRDDNPRLDIYRGPREENPRQDNYRGPREENPRQDNYRGPRDDNPRQDYGHGNGRRDREEDTLMHRSSGQRPPSPKQAPPGSDIQDGWVRDVLSRGGKIHEAIHDRQGKNAKELNVKKGELFEVLDDSRNWWKLANRRGEVGHAPYTILEPYNPTGMRYSQLPPDGDGGDGRVFFETHHTEPKATHNHKYPHNHRPKPRGDYTA